MGGLNNRMKNFRLLYVILPFLGGSLRAVPRCKITIKMRNYGALVAMCISLITLRSYLNNVLTVITAPVVSHFDLTRAVDQGYTIKMASFMN